MRISRLFLLIALCFGAYEAVSARGSGRIAVDLSHNDWILRLDTDARWMDDTLYVVPPPIASLPVHPPTMGWKGLAAVKGPTVHLPATVEEYFWGSNGNAFGLAGNYLGVSWFSTSVNVPASMTGRRIVLKFESVRFRAEVFANRMLAGYDLINSTPFDVDITRYVKPGAQNEIAVRITDPNGNFDWRDSKMFLWGQYRTIPSHGFGGITGKVALVATDPIFIDDIYIKNTPNPKTIDAAITAVNATKTAVSGTLRVRISEYKNDAHAVYEKEISVPSLAPGAQVIPLTVSLNEAKLWSVEDPNLYVMSAQWKGSDNSSDTYTQRFGFRWFEVKDIAGDKQFYLNGRRIVLRTAISWGFWPLNGITPSDELAKKQIETAKKIGLNMLNFHRTIGTSNVLDYADELGLLYFEEPGGYQVPSELFAPKDPFGKFQGAFAVPARREKLFRMIKRDRNHPSLVIYNLHNERGTDPGFQDSTDMRDAHQLDETRILTYNSLNGDIKMGPDPRFKLHLLPYDTTFRDYGWFDQHHAGGPGVYHDNLYKSEKEYLRFTDHKDEIIYFGEEGAIGTPPRLQLIRNEIMKTGTKRGWETDTYLKWYDAYDTFLKTKGFTEAFTDVDHLTVSMGNVAYYYQGRIIENIRINNITDGYAVNGWESMILENHSGIVDDYRNPKGDVDLIARYTKPLYVAVKLNRKVGTVGDTTKADCYLVNESDIHGSYTLRVKASDASGQLFTSEYAVTAAGGSVYGQPLKMGIPIVTRAEGYTTVSAELVRNGKPAASGSDDIFAVKLDIAGISTDGMILDTNQVFGKFLSSVGVGPLRVYKSGKPTGKYLIAGESAPPPERELVTNVLEWVNDGNTLIVVNNAEKWAEFLAQKEVLEYRGAQVMGKTWYGGNYVVKNHELFSGLPQACAFNWEYQCFSLYNRNRIGLRIMNGETVVGCVSDHKKEVFSALSVIQHGRGKIILCALDMLACVKGITIKEHAPDTEGQNAAFREMNSVQYERSLVVGQRLLLNMMRAASR